MAYGNNKERKDWLMRAYPLAVGIPTDAKNNQLKLMASKVLVLMRKMAQESFIAEPLIGVVNSKVLDANLVLIQKSEEALNACWAEQARMRVKPALEEGNKRYFRRLCGKLLFVDKLIPKEVKVKPSKAKQVLLDQFVGPVKPPRKYFNVPFEVQFDVTKEELDGLKAIAENKGSVELFRKVIIENNESGLTKNQIVIIRAIHNQSKDKHNCPDFGIKDRYTLQLHLDYRMLPTVKRKGKLDTPGEAMMLRNGQVALLKDDSNKRYKRFLNISGVAPRDQRIRIPVILTPVMAKRIEGTSSDWASLIVELTTDKSGLFQVGVRLVCGKPAPVLDLENIYCVVGRDFGYANTIALSVAKSDVSISLKSMQSELDLLRDKEKIKEHLANSVIPENVHIIERVLFSGKAFIDRATSLCTRIDAYQSKIDTAYNQLWTLKAKLVNDLGLVDGDVITLNHKKSNSKTEVSEFFGLLGLNSDLKRSRRRLYTTIVQLKKNWFGFLSNAEVKLAQKHSAIISRENLTVEAIEKDSSSYKGKSFNKLLNNGSKGQYQNRASSKLHWNGIPEILIPSWYTSRTCLKHSSIIEKKHRTGQTIYFPCCQLHDHADKHAADTIAGYLFLQKIVSPSGELLTGNSVGCDNHTSSLV